MITHDRLKELLHYDPLTGLFTWKIFRAANADVGMVAGRTMTCGYIQISVDGQRLLGHRLAWFYMTGYMPPRSIEVDHKDLNRANNKFKNLRIATPMQNMANRGKQVNNKSGYKGVCWHKREGKWRAQISINRTTVQLGSFDNKEDAFSAYCKAAEYRKEFINVGL